MSAATIVKSAGHVLEKFVLYLTKGPTVGGSKSILGSFAPYDSFNKSAADPHISFMMAMCIDANRSTSTQPTPPMTGRMRFIDLPGRLRINSI